MVSVLCRSCFYISDIFGCMDCLLLYCASVSSLWDHIGQFLAHTCHGFIPPTLASLLHLIIKTVSLKVLCCSYGGILANLFTYIFFFSTRRRQKLQHFCSGYWVNCNSTKFSCLTWDPSSSNLSREYSSKKDFS